MTFSSFSRFAVSSTNGHSCRSTFKSRKIPCPCSAEPSSNRANEAVAQFLGEIAEDAVVRRRNVGEQLLHQLVVVVGKFFEHLEARFLLTRGDRRRQLDDLALVLFAIDVGTLGREIDEAGGNAVFPNRDLAQHQRLGARRLQARNDVAHRRLRRVDLVQEKKMRNAGIVELLQDDLQRRDALRIGLADDDGHIAGGKRESAFVRELDRAGTVDEGEISPRKDASATLRPTLIAWSRASGVLSPTVDLAAIEPALEMPPVRARMASRSVVLPLAKGPISATQRAPRTPTLPP